MALHVPSGSQIMRCPSPASVWFELHRLLPYEHVVPVPLRGLKFIRVRETLETCLGPPMQVRSDRNLLLLPDNPVRWWCGLSRTFRVDTEENLLVAILAISGLA